MKKHELITPLESRNPFPIKFDRFGRIWEPGFSPHSSKDYFIVHEAAAILAAKKAIRRDKEQALLTLRRWVQEKRMKGTRLYRRIKKYGYLIHKTSFAELYEKSTGGDTFYETMWAPSCLITESGDFYIEKILELFEKKESAAMENLHKGIFIKYNAQELERKIELYRTIRQEYRKKWYEVVIDAKKPSPSDVTSIGSQNLNLF